MSFLSPGATTPISLSSLSAVTRAPLIVVAALNLSGADGLTTTHLTPPPPSSTHRATIVEIVIIRASLPVIIFERPLLYLQFGFYLCERRGTGLNNDGFTVPATGQGLDWVPPHFTRMIKYHQGVASRRQNNDEVSTIYIEYQRN